MCVGRPQSGLQAAAATPYWRPLHSGPTVIVTSTRARMVGMQRKLRRKSGPRQQALLLTLETFLAMTDRPTSQRHDRGGRRVRDAMSDDAPPPLQQWGQEALAPAHPRR